VTTGEAEEVPPKLMEQLKVGGRLVMPIGPRYGGQNLTVIEKGEDGLSEQQVLPVQFVPLTRNGE
jgi:protein-L-isoaspartate(D-aspartate) O-methyltransferase